VTNLPTGLGRGDQVTDLRCPNTPPCPHPGFVHDQYDNEDPYPTCCEAGCNCGHPGDAVLTRHADGTVTVDSAGHLIKVSRVLLAAPDLGPWVQHDDVIWLDTAGEYQYRYLRPHGDPTKLIDVYERVECR
jgi:hypothetical protein